MHKTTREPLLESLQDAYEHNNVWIYNDDAEEVLGKCLREAGYPDLDEPESEPEELRDDGPCRDCIHIDKDIIPETPCGPCYAADWTVSKPGFKAKQ